MDRSSQGRNFYYPSGANSPVSISPATSFHSSHRSHSFTPDDRSPASVSPASSQHSSHRSHRYTPDNRSPVSVSPVISQHSSHRSHLYTPDNRSPASSMSLSASPHTHQRPFQRSPAPGPSDNLVRYRAPYEPFPQSLVYPRGTHDGRGIGWSLHDRSPSTSRSPDSGSSNTHSSFNTYRDPPPSFRLEPAVEIHKKAPKNMRNNRPRALSTSSSISPQIKGFFPRSLIPSRGLTGDTTRQTSDDVTPQESSDGQMPLLDDFALMVAISAADADHREFPWYSVWARTLERYTFPSFIGECLVCNITPQHALVRSFDPSPPISRSRSNSGSGSVSSSWGSESGTEPKTPPRPTVIRPVFAKSHVIPDFVQIIRRIRLPRSIPPVIERERVILFTEIKPKRLQKKHLFASVTTQIKRQALHAFLGDSTLKTIGAIVAFGAIWKYVEFPRPVGSIPSNWSEHKDPTFGSRPNESYIVFRVPTFLKELSGSKEMSFNLMDPQGRSEVALKFLTDRILQRERDI
jgi:hypothetical protein